MPDTHPPTNGETVIINYMELLTRKLCRVILTKSTWLCYNDDKNTWHRGVTMKKEEILKASRNENKNKDLVELEVVYQAGIHAARVGALVSCIISVLSSLLVHTLLYSPWIIYFSIITTQWLVHFIKAKRKSDLVLAILFLSLAVLSFVGLVYRLLEVRV